MVEDMVYSEWQDIAGLVFLWEEVLFGQLAK
jgi:hypothetical protein